MVMPGLLRSIERGVVENSVTKNDIEGLRGTIAELREFIKEQFAGVHSRQDITNGRVQKGEIEQARSDVEIKNLGREVFGRRRRDEAAAQVAAAAVISKAADHVTDEEDKALTRRDLKTVAATLMTIAAIWAFMEKVLPLLKGHP